MPSSLEEMYLRVLRALENAKYDNRETPVFKKALEWVGSWPAELDTSLRRKMIEATCRAFNLTEPELWIQLDGTAGLGLIKVAKPESREDKLRSLLPKGGWFEWYDQFTRESEPPLSYHIFSSLCILGASLGRRVFRRMGHFSIYPNYCVILIGPTGRVKKTTAAEISQKIIKNAVLCPILADQVTPERMISVLKESGHHFIFAPEMSVFFGKQQYNAGMIPKVLRILDSPAEYIAETQIREQEILTDLAVTFLGCTTPSLLTSSMPVEVVSSGFLNRFVLVVENDTERCFPTPAEPPRNIETKLMKAVARMKGMTGEIFLSKEGTQWYDDWYRARWRSVRKMTDENAVEVTERAPMHLLRTAMLTHLVQCDNFQICQKCLETSLALITYTEQTAPKMFQTMKQTIGANDMDYVKGVIQKLGGAVDHSTLIRRVAQKMNSAGLKAHIKTLEEQGVIRVGKTPGGVGRYYILVEGGEG